MRERAQGEGESGALISFSVGTDTCTAARQGARLAPLSLAGMGRGGGGDNSCCRNGRGVGQTGREKRVGREVGGERCVGECVMGGDECE